MQGEGGIYPASESFLKGIRKICDKYEILMISDEIQCGMGRSGEMFAYLDTRLSKLPEENSLIKEIRGLGLMKGIELTVLRLHT